MRAARRFLVFVFVGIVGPMDSLVRRMVMSCAGGYTSRHRAGWAIFWARVLTWNFGFRVYIHGRRDPGSSQVIVSNHLSYMDILCYLAAGEMNFVSKADVRSWPLVSGLAVSAGTLFLRREKKADIPRVIEAFASVIRSGSRVIFFPEGTSSGGEEVLPFHSSLFDLPARERWKIQPSAIFYSIPGETSEFVAQKVCYWGDMEFLPHFLQLMRIGRVDCHIVFGDNIISGDNRKALAAQLHDEVVQLHHQARHHAHERIAR